MRVLLLVPASILSLGAMAQDDGRTPNIGVNYSIFTPSDAHTRNLLGSRWSGFGLGVGELTKHKAWATTPDVALLGNSKSFTAGRNKVLLIFGGLQATYAWMDSKSSSSMVPYAGGAADLVYADMDLQTIGVNKRRLSIAGSALAGLTFGKSLFVEARYRLMPNIEGINFTGLNLSIGVRF